MKLTVVYDKTKETARIEGDPRIMYEVSRDTTFGTRFVTEGRRVGGEWFGCCTHSTFKGAVFALQDRAARIMTESEVSDDE